MCRLWQEVPVAWAREKGRRMGRGKQKEWARRDKKSDPFAGQKNRTTNEYRQFPRLKWVVHSVHEAEQTRAVPENENITAVAWRSRRKDLKIYCSNFILEFQIICLFYLTDEN